MEHTEIPGEWIRKTLSCHTYLLILIELLEEGGVQ